MNKEFLKTNLTTILMIGATVVLGGVAIFTAIRLYQLRSESVAPNAPESQPEAFSQGPMDISPKSGNWSYPNVFEVTNTSNSAQEVDFSLDCWDETVCTDEEGTITLLAGETFEKGLGTICSKWQLDLNWSGKPEGQWDWGGVSEESDNCDTPPSSTTTPQLNACTELVFTLTTATATATATSTATATATATATSTATATATATSTATATATSTSTATPAATITSSPRPTSTTTSTPASLPAAGVSTPTIIGLGAGVLLLIGALVLAL